jgi:hypothetical protein
MKKKIPGRFSRIPGIFLALALFFAACPSYTGSDGGGGNGSGGDDKSQTPEPLAPPQFLGHDIRYDSETFTPSVVFTFNKAVTGVEITGGWVVAGDGGTVLTASPETPLVPGAFVTVTLSVVAADAVASAAENGGGEPERVPASADVLPVSGILARPAEDSRTYTIGWYGRYKTADAAIFHEGGGKHALLVADKNLQNICTAIYTPNAPDTRDRVEQGKSAAPFTKETSEKVLRLFTVTVGPGEDRVEIAGTDLPPPAKTPGAYYPVVIDIGVPDTDNKGLPPFYIGALGAENTDYSHIRLRVNQGAYLVIEPGNNGGEESHYGHVDNGTVEVMNGGAFRNGAGFPLGHGAVVIARLGSRLAAASENPDDWLVGSPGNAAVCWGSGDQNGGFIEIRDDGKLAFDTNLTIQKPLSLRYNVWFVSSPTLTVAAPLTPDEDGNDYRFYGTFFESGGQNPARPAAKIIIGPGGSISRSFLAETETDNAAGPAVFKNGGAAPGVEAVQYGRDSIRGYLNWVRE